MEGGIVKKAMKYTLVGIASAIAVFIFAPGRRRGTKKS